MTSTYLLDALFTAPRTKFEDIQKLQADQGIYGWFEDGKLVYVGKSKSQKEGKTHNRLVNRLLEHATGNSCVSSFVNYLRTKRYLSVQAADMEKYPYLEPVKVEEKKIVSYMSKHLEIVVIECDPAQLLEDASCKPEDFLFAHCDTLTEIKLWNNATGRSKKAEKKLK